MLTITNITIIMVNITIFINRRWLSACGWARQVLWCRVYNRGSNNLLLGEGHTLEKQGAICKPKRPSINQYKNGQARAHFREPFIYI